MILDVESSQEHAIWEFPDWGGADAKSRRELLRIFRKSKSCYLSDTDKLFGQFMRETCEKQLAYTRLAHARSMLSREPDRSITEVAFATGFNSSQYFANQFKKHFGLTPGNFRKGQTEES